MYSIQYNARIRQYYLKDERCTVSYALYIFNVTYQITEPHQ